MFLLTKDAEKKHGMWWHRINNKRASHRESLFYIWHEKEKKSKISHDFYVSFWKPHKLCNGIVH